MGIASFSPSLALSRFGLPSLSTVFAPFQAMVAFFIPLQPPRAISSPAGRPVGADIASRHSLRVKLPVAHMRAAQKPMAVRPSTLTRLKVTREFDPCMGRCQAGRMAISGTMADVCAELERIALRESQG